MASPHEAARRLVRLLQGNEKVAEFFIRFRALAGETGGPEASYDPISRGTLQPHSGFTGSFRALRNI